MKRIAGGLALAAGLLAFAPSVLAGEPGGAEGNAGTDRRLDEVLAELEVQRTEIRSLKARLAAEDGSGGVADAVKKYLESEEGKKALGRGAHDFKVFWKEGLTFETSDKAFSLKVQGRIMYDMVFPDADDDLEAAVADFDPIVRFRRPRVEMGGTMPISPRPALPAALRMLTRISQSIPARGRMPTLASMWYFASRLPLASSQP